MNADGPSSPISHGHVRDTTEGPASCCPPRSAHVSPLTSIGFYPAYAQECAVSTDDGGVAQFPPSVYYGVQCSALLREATGNSLAFGIVVLVRQPEVVGSSPGVRGSSSRVRRRAHPAMTSPALPCVGRTLTPRAIRAGHLQVRLVSKDFVADRERGEDASLCKSELAFRGGDLEKEFACRYKLGPVKEGIFGKVIIDHVRDCGLLERVLEFNLTMEGDASGDAAFSFPIQHSPSSPLGKDLSQHSAKRPVQEIAASLRIADGDNWRSLARHLGFSGKDLARFASSPAPFTDLVSAYQSRGGTADEIIQAMHDVSRDLSRMRQKRKRSGSPEVSRRLCTTPQISAISLPRAVVLGEDSDDDSDCDDVTGSRVCSETLELTPKGIFPLTSLSSSPFTITPPTTPSKCSPASYTCTDTDSDSSLLSESCPAKRMRRSLFSFDDPEDFALRMCAEKPTGGALWRISDHVTREWKNVGRTLNVPEPELHQIECTHAHSGLRKCAYRMLLKWKVTSPRKFTYGTLYAALCDNGLTAHAHEVCTFINSI